MNPLLLPPRLVLRALDDLHVLAGAAASLPAVEQRLTERIDALEDTVADAIERAAEINATAGIVSERLADVARALPELERALGTIEGINISATTLAQTVEPLQGAAERLGALADRLPQLPVRRRSGGRTSIDPPPQN